MVEKRSLPKHAILYLTAISVLLSPVIGLGATIDVHPGQKIQDAVNSASAGDTIIVHAGTYTENIEVKKRLTIKNAGDGGVTVNAGKGSDPCIKITSSGSGSTIQGLTLSGATSDDGIPLKVMGSTGFTPSKTTTTSPETTYWITAITVFTAKDPITTSPRTP